MFSTVIDTCFDTILSCSALSFGVPNTSSFIYRDELSKKPSPPKKKVIKKGDCCKDVREPFLVSSKEEDYCGSKKSVRSSINDDQDQQKGVIRVKVKMTKQEAARLMSKCKGGVIGIEDVANELARVPVSRVRVVPSNSRNGSCGVLETIPEAEI